METNWVWVNHPGLAWAPARIVDHVQGSKSPTLLTVEAEDGFKITVDPNKTAPVHKNSLSGVPDLLELGEFSMAALLHNVRVRFHRGEHYCGIGLPILISVNPYRPMPHLYSDETRKLYQQAACRSALASDGSISGAEADDGTIIDKRFFLEKPHLFATAQMTYSSLMRTKQAQSIVISGESGAGKTEATKILLRYFSELECSDGLSSKPIRSGAVAQADSIEAHTLRSNPILEAFGNAKTIRNDNSSRFGKFIQIHFDLQNVRRVKSARISHYLLEKCRLVSLHPGERNFHVFYQLILGGAKDEVWGPRIREWELDQRHLFKSSLGDDLDDWSMGNEHEMFEELLQCLDSVGFTDSEVTDMMMCVAGLLHLSRVEFDNVVTTNARYAGGALSRIVSYEPLIKACELLKLAAVSPRSGDGVNGLSEILLFKSVWNAEGVGSWIKSGRTMENAHQARDSMVKEIYSRLFAWIVKRINSALVADSSLCGFPGAAGPDITNIKAIQRRGAMLTKAVNQRKGSTQYNSMTKQFTPPIGLLDIYGFEVFEGRNSYEQLCINYANEKLQQHFNQHVLSLEQKTYQAEDIDWSEIRFSDNMNIIRALEEAPHGIFPILDDSRVSEQQCSQKSADPIFLSRVAQFSMKEVVCLPPAKKKQHDVFIVRHYAGQVEYNCHGFVEKNVDRLDIQSSKFLARSSSSYVINQLFPVEEFQDVVSRRNSLKATVSIEFRNQLNSLLASLTKTIPTYVRCIKPNSTKTPREFDSIEVLRQLEYAGLLESIRIRNSGFGVRCSFVDFLDDYACISCMEFRRYKASKQNLKPEDIREMITRLLKSVAPNPTNCVTSKGTSAPWQLGRTKVFMKESVQSVLEHKRSTMRKRSLIKLQSVFKMFLQRRRYQATIAKVVKIQSMFRQFRARRYYKLLKLNLFIVRWFRVARPCRREYLLRRQEYRKALEAAQSSRRGTSSNSIDPELKTKPADDDLLFAHPPAGETFSAGAIISTRESLPHAERPRSKKPYSEGARPTHWKEPWSSAGRKSRWSSKGRRKRCSSDESTTSYRDAGAHSPVLRTVEHLSYTIVEDRAAAFAERDAAFAERDKAKREARAFHKQLSQRNGMLEREKENNRALCEEIQNREVLIRQICAQRDEGFDRWHRKMQYLSTISNDVEALLACFMNHVQDVQRQHTCQWLDHTLKFVQNNTLRGRDALAKFTHMIHLPIGDAMWDPMDGPEGFDMPPSHMMMCESPMQSSASAGCRYPVSARPHGHMQVSSMTADMGGSRGPTEEMDGVCSRGGMPPRWIPDGDVTATASDNWSTTGHPPLPHRVKAAHHPQLGQSGDEYTHPGFLEYRNTGSHNRLRSVNLEPGRQYRMHAPRPSQHYLDLNQYHRREYSNTGWGSAQTDYLPELKIRASGSRMMPGVETPMGGRSSSSSRGTGATDPYLMMGGKVLQSSAAVQTGAPERNSAAVVHRTGVHSSVYRKEVDATASDEASDYGVTPDRYQGVTTPRRAPHMTMSAPRPHDRYQLYR